MNKMILATLALLMPLAAQASDLPVKKAVPSEPVATKATSSLDAFLSGAYGYNNWEASGCCNFEDYTVSLRGTFEVPITNQFRFQGDATLDSSEFPNSLLWDSAANWTTKSGTIHAFWRDPSVGLIGLIGQRSDYSVTDGVLGQKFYSSISTNYIGVEAQYFFNNVTLYGQVSYLNLEYPCKGQCNANGYAANAQIRYFPTNDIKLTLKGNYSEVTDSISNGTTSFQLIGARGEYRFPNVPVSVFADATYQSVSASGGCSSCITQTKALVGLNFYLSDKSLLERDRSGASLDPFESSLFSD